MRNQPCPNCGYCPTCGRGTVPNFPHDPLWPGVDHNKSFKDDLIDEVIDQSMEQSRVRALEDFIDHLTVGEQKR